MRVKTFPVRIKAAGEQDGTEEGVFEALVATYAKDSYGDVIMPGAFKNTLKEWEDSGDPIPVYWSHRMDDPDFNIGHVLEAKETDDGLWVRAQLDLENPKALTTYKLLKGRRVTQFSFAYEIVKSAYVDGEKDAERKDGEPEVPYFALHELKLFETGPTPIGANQETDLLDVKTAAGGRVSVLLQGGEAADRAAIEAALKGDTVAPPEPGPGDEPDGDDDGEQPDDDQVEPGGDGETKSVELGGETYLVISQKALAELKAGRTLSAKNETALKAALAAIKDGVSAVQGVLDAVGGGTVSDDDSKANDVESATVDEPAGVKTAEPARRAPADLRLVADLEALASSVS